MGFLSLNNFSTTISSTSLRSRGSEMRLKNKNKNKNKIKYEFYIFDNNMFYENQILVNFI
jgi:uncharacterized protein YcfL